MIPWHGFGDGHFFGPGYLGSDGVLHFFLSLLMMLLWVGFWIFVIVLVVRLIRRGAAEHSRPPTALHVLEERYARGEITREEFAERRAVLLRREPPTSTAPPPSP